LFDTCNSRNEFGKLFKAPLRKENEHQWLSLFAEATEYIKSLRRKDGTLVIESCLKTGFVGFLNGIFAFQEMFHELVTSGPLDQIMTYRFSQDHLELYFSAVRSKLGANNNPTCKQFTEISKRLLVHNQIKNSNGNAGVLDATELLTISAKGCLDENVDILSSRRSESPPDQSGETAFEEDQNLASWVHGLSEFKESVIVYISGYVVRMVQKKFRCEDCLSSLHASDIYTEKTHQLLRRKNWGSLIIPSEDVIKVCQETEKSLGSLLAQSQASLPKQKFLSQKVANITLKRVFSGTN
jgi:hypothetical protein